MWKNILSVFAESRARSTQPPVRGLCSASTDSSRTIFTRNNFRGVVKWLIFCVFGKIDVRENPRGGKVRKFERTKVLIRSKIFAVEHEVTLEHQEKKYQNSPLPFPLRPHLTKRDFVFSGFPVELSFQKEQSVLSFLKNPFLANCLVCSNKTET